jgi:hypothetical protein
VALENYTLLSPDALPLDDSNKEKLREVIAKSPLDLIEYWSIDPDYDGTVFRSTWQDYRGNTENDDDPLRVVLEAIFWPTSVIRDDRARLRACSNRPLKRSISRYDPFYAYFCVILNPHEHSVLSCRHSTDMCDTR